MADMAVISAILGSVKAATDIAKLIKDSDLSLEKAEFKLRLADLICTLADARIQVTEIQELLAAKDAQIQELEDAFQTKGKLVRVRDAYYLVDVSGSPAGQPYCMNCWQVKHKAYELHLEAGNRFVKVCPVCKTKYEARMVEGIQTATVSV